MSHFDSGFGASGRRGGRGSRADRSRARAADSRCRNKHGGSGAFYRRVLPELEPAIGIVLPDDWGEPSWYDDDDDDPAVPGEFTEWWCE